LLSQTAVSTALPTITNDLDGGNEFIWIGTAYTLSSTAFRPMSGNLADIFGRRPVMVLSIALFSLGSALAGSAQNMNWLIGARGLSLFATIEVILIAVCSAVQGIGGGGILSLSAVIVSDLVPLAERGLYQGVLILLWAFASAIGPPIVCIHFVSLRLR
jgi:MFS family permease